MVQVSSEQQESASATLIGLGALPTVNAGTGGPPMANERSRLGQVDLAMRGGGSLVATSVDVIRSLRESAVRGRYDTFISGPNSAHLIGTQLFALSSSQPSDLIRGCRSYSWTCSRSFYPSTCPPTLAGLKISIVSQRISINIRSIGLIPWFFGG
jgi:hypothetical protein